VFVCLRNSDGRLVTADDYEYGLNMLVYIIVVHELSHIFSYNVIGHNDIFWKNMDWFKTKAIEYNIYK
jgi:predicted metal-dependent hydrolase